MTPHPGDSLDFESVAARYASGEWTPREVVDAVLERIAAYPHCGVWIDLLPIEHVQAQVIRMEARRARGIAQPLYGLPFAVKDNIDVAGRPTTAACPAFAYTPAVSATAVERLCAAGAMLIGKTNLDQFATGLVGTRSPYGICRNTFDPKYISGGSSSGSAVAVAAGLVSFALGTDTAGSGRVPAGFNNIVGLKPTRGFISAAGVVPACLSLDCVSVMALTCDDARRVADVAIGTDAADPFSRTPLDLPKTAPIHPKQFRFGVPQQEQLRFFGNGDAARQFQSAVERLKGLGGTPVMINYAPFANAAQLLYDGPWLSERLVAVKELLSSAPGALLPVTRSIISAGTRFDALSGFESLYALQALIARARLEWGKMDVLLVPTAGTIYTVEEVEADPLRLNSNLGYYTNFVNLMDLCAVAVPSGFQENGLPLGITLIGPAGSEGPLLQIGDAFHRQSVNTLGATGCPLPAAVPPASNNQESVLVRLAVVGAHLSGQPLNHQLTGAGAKCLRTCRTAPHYRLFALPATQPPKPGLVRAAQAGGSIEVEVWEMDSMAFGNFVAAIPAPLGIGTILLEDGETVKGFVCEEYAIAGAQDITRFGGWRNFLKSS